MKLLKKKKKKDKSGKRNETDPQPWGPSVLLRAARLPRGRDGPGTVLAAGGSRRFSPELLEAGEESEEEPR